MKKSLILTAIATAALFFPACERQDWKETKMFHDVPKRVGDEAKKDAPAPHDAPKESEKHP